MEFCQGRDCAPAYRDDGAEGPPYKGRDRRVVLNHGANRAFVCLQTFYNPAVNLAYLRLFVSVFLLCFLGTVQQVFNRVER